MGCEEAPDTAHQAAAVGTSGNGIARSVDLGRAVRQRRVAAGLLASRGFKQIPDAREIEAALALGEESVMTDAVEAVGQDVEEKATDELVRGKPHDAASSGVAIILVGERHVIVVDGDQPRIGDRRAMRIAGEIGQYALGSAEGRLGVDDEGALPQRSQALGERGDLGERDQIAEETEFAATESGFQAVEGTDGGRSSTGRRTESRKLGLQATQR